MRDQVSGRVHDVSMSHPAQADPGHYVPDRLEAYLRNGYFHRVLPRRHCDRHVRLGVVVEVDGAEIGLSGPCGEESRRFGEVLAGAYRVQLETRNTDLFAAADIEVAHRPRRRNGAQKTQEIKLALLDQRAGKRVPKFRALAPRARDRRVIGGGVRGRSQLPLDLQDEALDPLRGRESLLALEPN